MSTPNIDSINNNNRPSVNQQNEGPKLLDRVSRYSLVSSLRDLSSDLLERAKSSSPAVVSNTLKNAEASLATFLSSSAAPLLEIPAVQDFGSKQLDRVSIFHSLF